MPVYYKGTAGTDAQNQSSIHVLYIVGTSFEHRPL